MNQIIEGTDVTLSILGDKNTYFVTKVIDQNHIFVRRYHVCLDRDTHSMNTWKYFKTDKEASEYINSYDSNYIITYNDHPEEEWECIDGDWKIVSKWDITRFNKVKNSKYSSVPYDVGIRLIDLERGDTITHYEDLSGTVEFFERDEYWAIGEEIDNDN